MVLLRFLDDAYPALTDTQQQAFESLLDQQDPELAGWIWGGVPAPTQWRTVIRKIQASAS